MTDDFGFEDEPLMPGAGFGTVEDLIQEIESQWAAFDAAVSGLTDEEMCRPNAVGVWSARDIMAHIAAWELEGARRIDAIVHGEGSSLTWPTQEEENAFNARAVESSRDKTMREVAKSLAEAHQDLVDLIASFGDEVLVAPLEVSAAEWIPGWTYLHYQEHTPQIRALKRE